MEFKNEPNHPIESRRLPPQRDVDEDDLERGDDTWLQNEINFAQIQKIQAYQNTSRPMTSSGTMAAGISLRSEYDERRKKCRDGRRNVQGTSFTELYNTKCTDDAHISYDDRDSRHDVCPLLHVANPSQPEDHCGDGDRPGDRSSSESTSHC